MTEVLRHNQRINFSRVVAYGCSFTAGSELADHEFFPDLTMYQVNELKKTQQVPSFYEIMWTKTTRDVLAAREQQLSWAKWFADYFNVDYLNRAISGGSNQAAIYRLEKDIANGIIKDDDLILIGITSPQRWFYFRDDGWTFDCNFGYAPNWPSEHFHNEFLNKIGNDNFIIYNLFHSLKYFDLLSSKLNGRVVTQFVHAAAKDYASWSNTAKDIANLYHSIDNFKSIIDLNYSFSSIVNWNTDVHGFHHPRAEFHKIFGETIAQRFNQNE